MDEKQITLTLPLGAINTILMGLDELPHKISRKLFDEIDSQVRPQIENVPQGPLSNKVIS